MDFKKLNEKLEKFVVNEISDELRASYIAGRQAQADKAIAKLNKAKQQVKKADIRDIQNLPMGIDKETATNALEDLKYEMRRIDYGSDWRLEENDGWMCLSVRYWGDWEGDDGSGDYDWQTLSDSYRDKLNSILTKIQKKYGVQIHEPGSEKNWLDFEIKITKKNKNSMFSYEDSKAWEEFLQKVRGKDITGPIQKKRGKLVASLSLFSGSGWSKLTGSTPQYSPYELHITPDGEGYHCYIRGKMGNQITIARNYSFTECLEKALEFYEDRNYTKKDKWLANKEKFWNKRQTVVNKQFEEIADSLKNWDAHIIWVGEDGFDLQLRNSSKDYRLTVWDNDKNNWRDYKYDLCTTTDENYRDQDILKTKSLQELINFLNKA